MLDSGLDYLAVRIAQTAQKQGVRVWSYYVERTDCPQWDRLVVALAEFLAVDGWLITDKDVEKLRRRQRAKVFADAAGRPNLAWRKLIHPNVTRHPNRWRRTLPEEFPGVNS